MKGLQERWTVEDTDGDDQEIVYPDTGYIVATVHSGRESGDAHLIAAAPALADALHGACDVIRTLLRYVPADGDSERDHREYATYITNKARAVLRAAGLE